MNLVLKYRKMSEVYELNTFKNLSEDPEMEFYDMYRNAKVNESSSLGRVPNLSKMLCDKKEGFETSPPRL